MAAVRVVLEGTAEETERAKVRGSYKRRREESGDVGVQTFVEHLGENADAIGEEVVLRERRKRFECQSTRRALSASDQERRLT